MSREARYERLMEMDTCGVERWDYRDMSVTDVVVMEFDGLEPLDRCADLELLDAVGLVGGSLKLAEGWGDSSPAVGLVEGDARPCVSTISADKRIKRIVHIKRQNDIEMMSADSSIVQVRDSVRVRENEQNKSSPDKGSQAIFSISTIIIVVIVILVIIILIRFLLR